MCHKTLILCLVLSLATQSAYGDITDCKGVWTNKPCQANPQREIPELKPTPRLAADVEADHKKLLIQELDTRRIAAREENHIEIGIAKERSECASAEVTLSECEKIVLDKEHQIDELIHAAQRKGSTDSRTPTIAPGQPEDSVTIIQNNNSFHERRRDGEHYDHEFDHSHHSEHALEIEEHHRKATTGNDDEPHKFDPPNHIENR